MRRRLSVRDIGATGHICILFIGGPGRELCKECKSNFNRNGTQSATDWSCTILWLLWSSNKFLCSINYRSFCPMTIRFTAFSWKNCWPNLNGAEDALMVYISLKLHTEKLCLGMFRCVSFSCAGDSCCVFWLFLYLRSFCPQAKPFSFTSRSHYASMGAYILWLAGKPCNKSGTYQYILCSMQGGKLIKSFPSIVAVTILCSMIA